MKKLALLVLCVALSSCEQGDPYAMCNDGEAHSFQNWSEAKPINERGSELVLGMPVNLTEVQRRTCVKCGLQQTRYFNGNQNP